MHTAPHPSSPPSRWSPGPWRMEVDPEVSGFAGWGSGQRPPGTAPTLGGVAVAALMDLSGSTRIGTALFDRSATGALPPLPASHDAWQFTGTAFPAAGFSLSIASEASGIYEAQHGNYVHWQHQPMTPKAPPSSIPTGVRAFQLTELAPPAAPVVRKVVLFVSGDSSPRQVWYAAASELDAQQLVPFKADRRYRFDPITSLPSGLDRGVDLGAGATVTL